MRIETKEDFEKALNDESWRVRRVAVWSEFFEAKHMDKALSDKDYAVRQAAKISNSHGIIRYLDDNYKECLWSYIWNYSV